MTCVLVILIIIINHPYNIYSGYFKVNNLFELLNAIDQNQFTFFLLSTVYTSLKHTSTGVYILSLAFFLSYRPKIPSRISELYVWIRQAHQHKPTIVLKKKWWWRLSKTRIFFFEMTIDVIDVYCSMRKDSFLWLCFFFTSEEPYIYIDQLTHIYTYKKKLMLTVFFSLTYLISSSFRPRVTGKEQVQLLLAINANIIYYVCIYF
jgi:hypothetical protein